MELTKWQVRLDKDIADKVRHIAETEYRSIAQTIKMMIIYYLETKAKDLDNKNDPG